MKRIGVIGAGRIVPFHLDSLREVGFAIMGICGRPSSLNAKRLALAYGIPFVYDRVEELIESDIDAVLIAVSKEDLLEVLTKAVTSGKKILVEKPVYVQPSHAPLSFPENVMVAYNRRFYKTVLTLKKRIQESDGGTLYCHIPELSSRPSPSPGESANELMGNTVHYLDLVRFLLEEDLSDVPPTLLKGAGLAQSCFVHIPAKRIQTILHLTFGSPGNYRLVFENGVTSIALSPLEQFVEYDSMEVVEPSPEFPLRKYRPSQSGGQLLHFSEDLSFKPGFYEQSKEFMSFVRGAQPIHGASLKEAFLTAKLASDIAHSITRTNQVIP